MQHLAELSHYRCYPCARALGNQNDLHFVQLSCLLITTELTSDDDDPELMGLTACAHCEMLVLSQLKRGKQSSQSPS